MIHRYLSILILSTLFATSCMAQTKRVSISLEYLQPYCGGARPTPEMEAESHTPKPLPNATVILIDSKNKAKKVKSNSKGIINLKLKPGIYNIKEVWRHKKATPNGAEISQFDPNCLNEEWKVELIKITVTKTDVKTEAFYNITKYCEHSIPCLKEVFLPPMRE
jgi:hypothetical protein